MIKNTELGKYTYVGPDCRIFEADIGNFVSIGPRVIAGEAEHIIEHDFLSNSLLSESERNAYDADRKRRTVFEPDCWVGAGAIVRKGVRVGRGAVIGAGAVVVKDVLPYSVVGGIPAKLLKMRFDEQRIRALEESRWWEMPPEDFRVLRSSS